MNFDRCAILASLFPPQVGASATMQRGQYKNKFNFIWTQVKLASLLVLYRRSCVDVLFVVCYNEIYK